MLAVYVPSSRCVVRADAAESIPPGAVWLDLLNPTRDEEVAVEKAVGVEAPTREEMHEIEFTSRVYAENDALYMTVIAISHLDGERPASAPITFVLAGDKLVTIRYSEPRSIGHFVGRAQKPSSGLTNGPLLMLGMLEALVDRLADSLEAVAGDIDALSNDVLSRDEGRGGHDFKGALRRLGRKGELTSKIRESLVSIVRVNHFAQENLDPARLAASKDVRNRLKALDKDVASLLDQTHFLSTKVSFLLDATLGLINIEQNGIIKLFSVVSVALMPPTLIASIYGMNFQRMPELSWPYGYPMAVGMMVVSALVPLWYFKRRGWL